MRSRSNILVGFTYSHTLGVGKVAVWSDVVFFPTGMMRRWDDSQKYLSDNPHLVCEETANYLVIMCIDLEVEEVNSPEHTHPRYTDAIV